MTRALSLTEWAEGERLRRSGIVLAVVTATTFPVSPVKVRLSKAHLQRPEEPTPPHIIRAGLINRREAIVAHMDDLVAQLMAIDAKLLEV